ncbi:type IV pilus assembly PilZ [Desulfovibrio sp. X2]|uniref:PilZ domain-containing protein n=1 Tax=Desulfovibrio sp. X2 TaxID=941449 RepID=UPI000358D1C4|nr:PilZ domain-containing protein [Desulfovibrio sp. X2]EPR42837.1 type IV pilus assembly PilZ [Desulfovibrio sp. X2]
MQPAGPERRREPRTVLDVVFCILAARSGCEHLCIVRDISRHGARLEFASAGDAASLCTGGEVRLRDLPGVLSCLHGNEWGGRVVWLRGEEGGIRFDDPLPATPEALEAYRRLQLDMKE